MTADHKAAMNWCFAPKGPGLGRVLTGEVIANLEAAYLLSVRAAWPGAPNGMAARVNGERWITLDTEWQYLANRFERTYGLKVDDPELVAMMEKLT